MSVSLLANKPRIIEPKIDPNNLTFTHAPQSLSISEAPGRKMVTIESIENRIIQ